MTKPFDINRHIIETSLKYDDHTPKERQELENYLKPAIVKKTKPKQLMPHPYMATYAQPRHDFRFALP